MKTSEEILANSLLVHDVRYPLSRCLKLPTNMRRLVIFVNYKKKRLVDHLHSLKVKGEVIETNLDDSQFDRAEIGEQLWFVPPVPDRAPCNRHLFICMIVALIAGALAIWGIASYFHGKTAFLLSLVAAAGISVIAWARICSHEQSK